MTRKYEITDVEMISGRSDSMPRNVTLRVGEHSLDRISKCTERTTDIRTIASKECGKVLNECYINLSLNKLRELDSNREAQDQYILGRSKFLDRGLINVLMIKLRLEGNERLEDSDYDYLNSLLSWGRNDIYVMPILEFGDKERTDKVSEYNEFVKKMLEEKKSWTNVNVGMSIPQMYPRRSIEDLFEIYSDERPTFVAVDFNNGRMDRPSDVTGTIMKHFNDEKEEKTFLYGINVKPFKRGADNTSAWDIYMVHGSFNAIGPTHTKAHPVVVPGDWSNIGRIFDPYSVEYCVMDDSHRDIFIDWMQNSYGVELDRDFKRNQKAIYPYLKRYNFQMSNGLLGEFSTAIREGDADFVDRMVDVMPEEMKGINIMARKFRARRSKIDHRGQQNRGR